MDMPPLETGRLVVRPFEMADLEAIHAILDDELAEADFGSEGALPLAAREEWLRWTILSYRQYAQLYQPPLGDRALVLKESGALIGAVGYAPALNAFDRLPSFGGAAALWHTLEIGLYWAVSPRYQGRGYATEAGRALIDYAFAELRLNRIVATTTYDNEASMAVMRKLGMRIERNPGAEPPWLQAVGVLERPA